MAAIPVFIRIAKTKRGYKVSATSKPTLAPLKDSNYSPSSYFPTVQFGIRVHISDEDFKKASEIIAEFDYRKGDVTVADQTDNDLKIEISKDAIKNLGGGPKDIEDSETIDDEDKNFVNYLQDWAKREYKP